MGTSEKVSPIVQVVVSCSPKIHLATLLLSNEHGRLENKKGLPNGSPFFVHPFHA
jgi:hypothetical protein